MLALIGGYLWKILALFCENKQELLGFNGEYTLELLAYIGGW